jgi:Transposase, Mutator family
VTRFGTIRLRIARTRGKSFLLVGLRRFQRRAQEVSLLIREAFLRGISTRQVGRVVATITGETVSAQETPGTRIESLQQFDRKLTLNVPYHPVSADTAHVLFNWQKPPEACKPYEGYDRLVAFSAVDFNSDQPFAVVQITLLRGICAGPNKEPFGWSGPRMLQKKCGKWKVVRSEGFSDVAIN